MVTSTLTQVLTWHTSLRDSNLRFQAEFTRNRYLVRAYLLGSIIVSETIYPSEIACREGFENKVVSHYKEDV